MTTPTGIDRDAPVITRHEIDIAAPLDTVWNLHTDVDAWPAWNLEVTAAKLDGAFAPPERGSRRLHCSKAFSPLGTMGGGLRVVPAHARRVVPRWSPKEDEKRATWRLG